MALDAAEWAPCRSPHHSLGQRRSGQILGCSSLVSSLYPFVPRCLECKGVADFLLGRGGRALRFRSRLRRARVCNIPQGASTIVLVDPHEFGKISARELGTGG